MNLSTIRADIAARAATVSGLTGYARTPAKPEVPCAIVRPASIHPHSAFESADVRLAVQVLVQLSDWESAQDALDAYCSDGASSLRAAIEAPGGSGGTENVTVESIDTYGHVSLGDSANTVDYASVTFNVLVLA